MRTLQAFFVTLSLLAFLGCEGAKNERLAESEQRGSLSGQSVAKEATKEPAAGLANSKGPMQQVSLRQADQSQSIAEAVDRKIIKDAEFTLEVNFSSDAHRPVESLSEWQGGC